MILMLTHHYVCTTVDSTASYGGKSTSWHMDTLQVFAVPDIGTPDTIPFTYGMTD